jgi:hypothetical protein
MAFTETQTRSLKAKLKCRHVKTRESNGAAIPYVEGWHAIVEANRIFGFDSWDRQTLAPRCHWAHLQSGQTVCFYSTKVRITVRAGETVTVREGIGTGLGRSPQPEIAHDVALKSAETDATKRALATFGNPFGLALYDRDQAQVTKPRQRIATAKTPVLRSADLLVIDNAGHELRFADHEAFVTESLRQIERLDTVDSVYAFWSTNLRAFAELYRRTEGGDGGPARQITDALKDRVRSVGPPHQVSSTGANGIAAESNGEQEPAASYLIPKEKRFRDRAHLAFVASQPCLVCGRRPAQAHYLRFAQPRAMALKVSDEFTVPVCNTHHDELHRTGDERAWWARHGIIEPLKYAARLWAASRDQRKAAVSNGNEALDPDTESEFNDPYLRKGSGATGRST